MATPEVLEEIRQCVGQMADAYYEGDTVEYNRLEQHLLFELVPMAKDSNDQD